MKKFLISLLALMTSMMSFANGSLILTNPNYKLEYQVTSMSPNGKWACGTINDGYYRGFVWNLETGIITELSTRNEFSNAMGVSNDGTVVGEFTCYNITSNGADVIVAGAWKDGKWTALDYITDDNNIILESRAYSISPDGKVVVGLANTGGVNKNARYVPVMWKNGEIKILPNTIPGVTNPMGAANSVSNDGKVIAGWVYAIGVHGIANRTMAIWVDGELKLIEPTLTGGEVSANKVSPNGKYVLGYDRVYNVETGVSDIFTVKNQNGQELTYVGFSDINDNGIGIGTMKEGAPIIYQEGKLIDLIDYLANIGLDTAEFQKNWSLITGVAISEDAKTFSVMAYDTASVPFALNIQLDVETANLPPVALSAKQIPGLNAVELTWCPPVKGSPKGYNVFRNETKINNEIIVSSEKNIYFTDKSIADTSKEIVYTVKAVYENDIESAASKSAQISVNNQIEIPAVTNLKAKENTLNTITFDWEAPITTLPKYSYVEESDQVAGLGGGEYSIETAIVIDKNILAAYSENNSKIAGLTFYPMSRQKSWTVNIYTDDINNPIYTETFDGSNFIFGQENKIILSTPFEIPENKDLTIGIFYNVEGYGGYNVAGIVFNKTVAGYSDLLRREGEDKFFSLYEQSTTSEEPYEYSSSWAMGVLFDNNNTQDEIEKYNIYINDQLVSDNTTENKYIVNNFTDGTHKFAVETIWKGPKTSAKTECTVEFKTKEAKDWYLPVEDIYISSQGTMLNMDWEVPSNVAEDFISYANDKYGTANGVKGNLVAIAQYEGDILKGKDGHLITEFYYYPIADALFAFFVNVDNEEVLYYEIEDYTLNQWNKIVLEEPIVINSQSTYQFCMDCYDVADGAAALAIDQYPALAHVSDIYTLDMEEFKSVTGASGVTIGNWLFALKTKPSEEHPNYKINGYYISLNGEKINNTPWEYTSCSIDVKKAGTYTINIAVDYENIGTIPSKDVVYTIDLPNDIDNNELNNTHIVSNKDYIEIISENEISNITIYNANGMLIKNIENNNIVDITTLSRGTYLARVTLDNGTSTTLKFIK